MEEGSSRLHNAGLHENTMLSLIGFGEGHLALPTLSQVTRLKRKHLCVCTDWRADLLTTWLMGTKTRLIPFIVLHNSHTKVPEADTGQGQRDQGWPAQARAQSFRPEAHTCFLPVPLCLGQPLVNGEIKEQA